MTVCHETNFASAKLRKLDKYKHLNQNLNPPYLNYNLKINTLEVSVLGFISDLTPFLNHFQIKKIPLFVSNKITLSAMDHSRNIYYNRDNPNNDIV